MNKVFCFLGIAALPVISSCSSVEECSTAEVQELLMTSVKQEMLLQVGEEKAGQMTYEVRNISHKGESEKPGREQHECFAELLLSSEGEETVDARPLSFSVIRHDTGELRLKINRI